MWSRFVLLCFLVGLACLFAPRTFFAKELAAEEGEDDFKAIAELQAALPNVSVYH